MNRLRVAWKILTSRRFWFRLQDVIWYAKQVHYSVRGTGSSDVLEFNALHGHLFDTDYSRGREFSFPVAEK